MELAARLTELALQLNQKDTELDEELDNLIQADEEALNQVLDAFDRDVEAADKNLRDYKICTNILNVIESNLPVYLLITYEYLNSCYC
jgi:formiminotetrahydrofolate cyclodeaminase